MKKMMFIPILLTLFAGLHADNNQSSAYGTTSPTYAPKTGGISSPTINSPQTQVNRGISSQTTPNFQSNQDPTSSYNSGQNVDTNSQRLNSDVRSNPGLAGQQSNSQGANLQGTYYQGQNLQGTYNQNQYEKEIYQNQNLHDQYQRGQGNLNNNNMPAQPNNPGINNRGQIKNLAAMNEQNVYNSNQSRTASTGLKSSSSKYPQDKYATESDRDINSKIRNKITGWFTDDYKNISIVTDNGKTFIEGFVDNQKAKNTLQNDAKYIQPDVSFNVQVRS